MELTEQSHEYDACVECERKHDHMACPKCIKVRLEIIAEWAHEDEMAELKMEEVQ